MSVVQFAPRVESRGVSPFDEVKRVDGGGEWWSARDLMPIMGYSQWRRFAESIDRAKAAASAQGADADSHFAGGDKVTEGGRWGHQTVEDFRLTRYAAYLVAMNGDPRKPEVAAAQSYFAINTYENEVRKAEPQFEIPATYAAALRLAADQTERAELAENNVRTLKAAREQDKPKVESFEALMNSDGLYTIGNAAKIIHTGQNRLFKLLRDNDVLIQNGHRKNTPYQYFMNQEYFSVKTDVYQSRRTGISHENHQTFVTPRGLDWLRKKITEWT